MYGSIEKVIRKYLSRGCIETQSEQYQKITHFQNPKPATKYSLHMSKHRQAETDLLPAFGNEWSLH